MFRNLMIGAIHFLNNTKSKPVLQANHFEDLFTDVCRNKKI